MLFPWYLFLSLFWRAVVLLTWPLAYLGCPWCLDAIFYVLIYDELTTRAWDGA